MQQMMPQYNVTQSSVILFSPNCARTRQQGPAGREKRDKRAAYGSVACVLCARTSL